MPPSKYAADIAAIKATQVDRAVTQAENAVILQNIASRQNEMLQAALETNRCVKQQGQALVALETWRTEHEKREDAQDTEVRGLRKRINAAATANALWSPVASIIAVMFGQN